MRRLSKVQWCQFLIFPWCLTLGVVIPSRCTLYELLLCQSSIFPFQVFQLTLDVYQVDLQMQATRNGYVRVPFKYQQIIEVTPLQYNLDPFGICTCPTILNIIFKFILSSEKCKDFARDFYLKFIVISQYLNFLLKLSRGRYQLKRFPSKSSAFNLNLILVTFQFCFKLVSYLLKNIYIYSQWLKCAVKVFWNEINSCWSCHSCLSIPFVDQRRWWHCCIVCWGKKYSIYSFFGFAYMVHFYYCEDKIPCTHTSI